MKKTLCILLAVLVSGIACAVDYTYTVPADTSFKLAPSGNISFAVPWAEGVEVSQGQLVKSGQRFYMSMTVAPTETGATAPSHGSGIVTDGAVLWLNVSKKHRSEILVTQESAGDVWYHDNPIVAGEGGAYNSGKGEWYHDDTNAPVYVWCSDEMKFSVKDRTQ